MQLQLIAFNIPILIMIPRKGSFESLPMARALKTSVFVVLGTELSSA